MTEAGKFVDTGLSFDDVLIVPTRSDIRSRSGDQIDTATEIARGAAKINIPIVSANMDTVTEARMATAMAFQGGIGIIHRFLPIAEQVAHVQTVKERMRIIEEDPPRLPENATVQDALDLLEERKRGYVIVLPVEDSPKGTFAGIATSRDFKAAESSEIPLGVIMTPRKNVLTVPKGTSRNDAVFFMQQNRFEKVPVVDSENNLVGVYALKDDELYREYPNAALDNLGRLVVGAAIGVQEHDVERALRLEQAGADVLVLDIAHGELDYTEEMLKRLKITEQIRIPIIAGNVATQEGTQYLIDSGADGGKIGIGPGFVCDTRDVAGAGVEQVTAIYDAATVAAQQSEKFPIIADGGIKKPGDVSKAIAAGAQSVMIGSLFAGTDESPGEPTMIDGHLHKMVRGMASASAFADRQRLGDSTTNTEEYVPEGHTTFTPYKGPVSTVIRDLVGGLRSGMSYTGTHSIEEMNKRAQLGIRHR